MTTKNNTAPNIYVCATMGIKGLMLLIRQVSKRGEYHIKLCGGTYLGAYEIWKRKGEEANHFFIHLQKEVRLKSIKSLNKAFGLFASKKIKDEFPEIVDQIMKFINTDDQNFVNPIEMQYAKTVLVMEWIEEMGIIPLAATFIGSSLHGEHTKYSFEVTKAKTFSAKQRKFILVETADDIPQRGIDFECADFEVKETLLLTEKQTRASNFGRGIHSFARDIIFLNWSKQPKNIRS
jgi:hypothetical protein